MAKIYIAYGSNMNIGQMKKRCPKAELYGIGNLLDYSLQFRGEGHANIYKNPGGKIPVLLWKITEECEKSLDIYEAYPNYYIKKDILARLDEKDIKGMVYIMASEKENTLARPSKEYFEAIVEAYRENNIDNKNLYELLEENRLENIK